MSLVPNSFKEITLRVAITRSSVNIFKINSIIVSNLFNIGLADPHPLSNQSQIIINFFDLAWLIHDQILASYFLAGVGPKYSHLC